MARRPTAQNSRRGFTLIEASLAVIIVGVGVLAALGLFAACSQQNANSNRYTTALMLANNIQETMIGVSFTDPGSAATHWGIEGGESLATYNDLDDFDGLNFSPPIDALRTTVPNLSTYTQHVSVMPVDPNTPGGNSDEAHPTISKGTYTGAVRVRVTIYVTPRSGGQKEKVLETSWIRADE